MSEPRVKPFCHLCQTDDVTVTEVRQEPLGPGIWGADGQALRVPVQYFDCNVCGREQSITG